MTADEIPPAQKARTIAHMNKDHRANMRHILAHRGSVPHPPAAWLARAKTLTTTTTTDNEHPHDDEDPLMEDITLTSFTVRLPSSGTTHAVAFDPPLASWGERRERLVGMTREAVGALGADSPASAKGEEKEGVVVAEYVPPRVPYDAAVFASVLYYFATFALVRMGWFQPGGTAGRVLEAVRFPGGVGGFTWLVDVIFVPVLAIHVAETWWLERTRLRRYGVRRGSRVWWMWMGSVFIEGLMAFKRFDAVVERLKREGKKER